MNPVWSVLALLAMTAGGVWAAYLVTKDFEPSVGQQRARLYGVLFFVSWPALAVLRAYEMRRKRE